MGANPMTRPGGLPPARSFLSTTANRLIAEYSLARTENNSDTDLVYIKINVNHLFSTYANTLKPIVYGNFRNIGARTVTDNADTTFLNNVILTVATNAVVCTYAVAFNKAAKLDAGAVTLFGDFNPVDANRFPALTSSLITSLGPVEAQHLPFKCTFIPYLDRTDVNALIQQNGYTTHFYESFLQAMKRGRTVLMTDVNVHEVRSSAWWTLYMDNQRPSVTGNVVLPGHITAYNPNSFDDRETAIILAALVLEDTLYDLPGPLITTTIGPFACANHPRTINDIPEPFNSGIHINRHVPALFIKFEHFDELNHANALTFGQIQDDDAITGLSELPFPDSALPSKATQVVQPPTKKTKSGTSSVSSTTTKSGPTDSLAQVGTDTHGLYTATVLYFDHVLANKVPHSRRSNVVTDANKAE